MADGGNGGGYPPRRARGSAGDGRAERIATYSTGALRLGDARPTGSAAEGKAPRAVHARTVAAPRRRALHGQVLAGTMVILVVVAALIVFGIAAGGSTGSHESYAAARGSTAFDSSSAAGTDATAIRGRTMASLAVISNADAVEMTDSSTEAEEDAAELPLAVGPTVGFAENVVEITQDELTSGCEPASLTCLLDSMGYDVTLEQLVEEYLPFESASDDEDATDYYFGDPYSKGGALPPAIVRAGNNYLAEQGSAYRLCEATGLDREELSAWLSAGYPVLVWTTMYLDSPLFSGEEVGDYAWYVNEHCMLAYRQADDEVMVNDPLVGLISYDADEFWDVYDSCGRMSVVVVPVSA